MDNVCICFFGISYDDSYKHWIISNPVSIDYRRSLENYEERIFSRIPNHTVYFSTYDHELINDMQKDLHTKRGLISQDAIKSGLDISAISQRNRILSRTKLILEKTEYEWYIFTRFDLQFNFNIDDLSPVEDKINVLVSLEQSHLLCDNFYIIHRSQLPFFYECLNARNVSSLNRHDCNFFRGMDNVHLLLNEKGKRVDQLECYKIVRE